MALPMISQSELISELAEELGWSKSDVKHFFEKLGAKVEDAVADGYRIKLPPGVVVEPVRVAARKARMGRNPATGEAVKIKAKPASSKIRAKVVLPLKGVKAPSPKKLEAMS